MNHFIQRTHSFIIRNTVPVNHTIFRNEYESAYSLKKLYPNSKPNITSPSENELPKAVQGKFSGYIPIDKLKITTSCASGPGGQRVNKIQTKVDVRFHLETADWIPLNLRKILLEQKKNQLTKDGYWVVRADKTRSQQMNLADALQRIRHIIYKSEDGIKEVDPELDIVIRKRKERANELRLKMKKHRQLIHQFKQFSDE